MAVTQQREFLAQITPFNLLAQDQLNELADSMDIAYLPTHTQLKLKDSESSFIYLIIKGEVSESQDNQTVAHYSVRGFFGDAEILDKTDHHSVYEVTEETITYTLPKKAFLNAIEANSQFSSFFNASIVDKLNRIHESIQSATSTEVMMDTVCSAHIQELVIVNEHASMLDVSKKMVDVRADACLVEFENDEVGIVTSTDVLKFVANESPEQLLRKDLLSQIASKPVYSVHEYDLLFNALLKMTRCQIDRLVVRNDQEFIGFLTNKDLMSLFANQSGLVLLKVDQARTLNDLIHIGPQIDQLIGNLNRKGIKTHYIAKLVNELHRKMVVKLIDLLLPSSLNDKVCIFVMGSEGRSEQVIRTDQDNGLIYSDDLTEDEVQQLDSFANEFTQAMQAIGFPPCPGNIMLSNPYWRLTRKAFKARIEEWFKQPSEQNFMHASILIDAESVYGPHGWLVAIKNRLNSLQEAYPVFLRHFAIAALQFNTPIGFFGGLVVDKNDQDKKALIDIKKGGIFPIVHGIRCYALEKGIEQTNTHWRIKALMDQGVFKNEFGVELGETLNYLNTLRLESMLKQLSDGNTTPNNKISVSDLSHMQQDILKQSFSVVEKFKKRLTQHFNLQEMT